MSALETFIRQARILIVDDELANVRLLEAVLEEDGQMNFKGTTDSRQALALFHEYKPDIVLLDLMMPFLDGFAVMEQLRGVIPPDQNLPIVVLTADVAPSTRRRALAAGARDFLTKPFDADELHLRTRNLLEMRFLHLGLQSQNRALDARVRERTKELEAAMSELQQAHRNAMQQSRLLAFREMAGGVVHDFNNSLSVLTGYSEILLSGVAAGDPVRTKRYLQTMNTAAHDATQVVNRLRDFYRQREHDETFVSADLGKLIEQSVQISEPRWKHQALAEGRTITLQYNLLPTPPISCNAAELREVFLNLILNSLDAMPEGGLLGFRTLVEGDRAICEIIDTGAGMTEEVRQRCLEPFFSTKGDKGTGLGLAMVSGILHRHQAEVEIDSAPGLGTSFRLSFPTRAADAFALENLASTTLKPLRILVADDDADLREIVAAQLSADSHIVSTAADGVEAFDLFVQGTFDLVLTDLSMPRMNGQQLASAIKGRDPSMPVIMITGFGAMLLPEGNQPQDVDLLLSKPVSAGDLTRVIARTMKSRQPTDTATVAA